MTTEERIDEMEKRMARTRRLMAVLVAVSVSSLVWAVTQPGRIADAQGDAKEVRAERFVLVDEEGDVRGELGIDERGGSGLTLFDEQGTKRAWMDWSNAGSRLGLANKNGDINVLMFATEKMGSLMLIDQGHLDAVASISPSGMTVSKGGIESNISLTLGKEGEPGLYLRYRDGASVLLQVQTLGSLLDITEQSLRRLFDDGRLDDDAYREAITELRADAAADKGTPMLMLTGEKGKLWLRTGDNGPSLGLYDEKGKTRAMLEMVGEEPNLKMLDDNGKPSVVLGRSEKGPGLSLYDEKGGRRAILGSTEDGAALAIFDDKGEPRGMLGVREGGTALELTDAQGKTRAMLSVLEGNPVLMMRDAQGKPCAMLGGREGGTALMMSDDKGEGRVWLGMFESGPALSLYDEKGEERASLGVREGGPALSLRDDKGKPRVGLSVLKGNPSLGMLDAQGNPALMMSEAQGNPALMMSDDKGKPRALLQLLEGKPMLTMFDDKGEGRVWLGTGKTETPDGRVISYPESSLRLFNKDGNLIWQAP